MSASDETIRISVVIHREIDTKLFDYLNAFKSPRVRSDAARRLLADGAKRLVTQKSPGSQQTEKPDPPRSQVREKQEPGEKPGEKQSRAVDDQSGLGDFVRGVQGVGYR